MSELKACPFCGRPAVTGVNQRPVARVFCPDCIMIDSTVTVERWNTRAITSDVEKVIHDAAIEAVLNVGDAAKYGATDLDRHIQAAIAAVKARRGGKL